MQTSVETAGKASQYLKDIKTQDESWTQKVSILMPTNLPSISFP